MQVVGTLWGCRRRTPHEPHVIGHEVRELLKRESSTGQKHHAKICLGIVNFETDTLMPHPAGGLYSIRPAFPGSPVEVSYVHEDDEQEALAEADDLRQLREERVARPRGSKVPPRQNDEK